MRTFTYAAKLLDEKLTTVMKSKDGLDELREECYQKGRKERRKDFSGERADVIGPSEIVAAVDEFRKKTTDTQSKTLIR